MDSKAVAVTGGIFGAVVGAATGTAMVAVSEKIAALKTWQKVLVVASITGLTAGGIAGLSYISYSALTR